MDLGAGLGGHEAVGHDAEDLVRSLQREKTADIAIHIRHAAHLRGLRIDAQLVVQQRLPRVVARVQVGHMLRCFYCRVVPVVGVVRDLQQHQVPRLWLVSPAWVK